MSSSYSQRLTKDSDVFRNLQNEINDLKSTTDKLTNDSDALNNLQQATDLQIEQFKERLENFEDGNRNLTQKVYRQMEAKEGLLNKMHEKTDQLEQIHKMNNIRIAGLAEEEEEEVQLKVISLAQRMNLTIGTADIKDARRMGPVRHNKTRDILVKFTNSRTRDTVYQGRKVLRSTTDQVYINEDLTQHRSLLFYEGRRLRRQGRIFGVWSQQGNILIKVNQESQPRAVSNYKEIITLIEKPSSLLTTNIDSDQEEENILDNDSGDQDSEHM